MRYPSEWAGLSSVWTSAEGGPGRAAVALYAAAEGLKLGRVAPGIPGPRRPGERRDRVPSWHLRQALRPGPARGSRGPPRTAAGGNCGHLIRSTWGKPLVVVLDRFRLAEFEDAVKRGARLEPRVSRWSESSFDIRALRQMALDGPLAVDGDSQALLATSLAQAMVKSDDAGNVRLQKSGFNLLYPSIDALHSRLKLPRQLSRPAPHPYQLYNTLAELKRVRPSTSWHCGHLLT